MYKWVGRMMEWGGQDTLVGGQDVAGWSQWEGANRHV